MAVVEVARNFAAVEGQVSRRAHGHPLQRAEFVKDGFFPAGGVLDIRVSNRGSMRMLLRPWLRLPTPGAGGC